MSQTLDVITKMQQLQAQAKEARAVLKKIETQISKISMDYDNQLCDKEELGILTYKRTRITLRVGKHQVRILPQSEAYKEYKVVDGLGKVLADRVHPQSARGVAKRHLEAQITHKIKWVEHANM